MPYFLFPDSLEVGQICEIRGRELTHIRSARKIRVGEIIELQDNHFRRFEALIEISRNQFLQVKILKPVEVPPEPETRISLYFPILKEKPFDWILQKATELGATSLFVFCSEYSKPLPTEGMKEKRLERWQRICEEACKQSERQKPPSIEIIGSFADTVAHSLEKNEISFLFHHLGEGHCELLENRKLKTIGLFIGPEGGFSEKEALIPEVKKIKAGPRVMKAETAAVIGLGLLQFLHGDLKD